MLYELYDNRAAFDIHRSMPHFLAWREAASRCLRAERGQQNTYLTVVFGGNGGHVGGVRRGR
jgi:quinol monooxygenase YgiN